MATATIPNSAIIRLRLELPSHIMNEYERQAAETGLTLEEILATRLTTAVLHTSSKPIYLTDANRQEIEGIFRRNFTTAAELIKEIRTAARIRVDSVRVTLGQEVRRRLASRQLDKTISYDEHVARTVNKLLQEYVGQ